MSHALRVEWRKLRRSTVPATATLCMVALLPLVALGFYRVAQNGGAGPLAQKAGALLVGEGWEGYLGVVGQIAAVAVFLGAGIVVAWAFGREHVDRTFSALFALPISRSSIAAAKLVVLTGWAIVLSVMVVSVAFGLGAAAGVEGETTWRGLLTLLVVTLSAAILAISLAFVASIGRGYLAAVGTLILIVAAAQVAVLFGTGQWFPYAVPGLLAVAGSEGIPVPGIIQMALVPLTGGIGAWLTVRWWRNAEVV